MVFEIILTELTGVVFHPVHNLNCRFFHCSFVILTTSLFLRIPPRAAFVSRTPVWFGIREYLHISPFPTGNYIHY